MTRKNFEAIANIFKTKAADYDSFADDAAHGFDQGFAAGQLQALTEMGEEMADYFATVNPNFDRVRFLEACGL